MQIKIRDIITKNVIKIFLGSGISTVVKIITGVLLSKVIADHLGPHGLGLIGQLTSFISIMLLIGTGGFQNGIISLTSLYQSSDKLEAFIKPTFKLTLLVSLFFSISLLLFASYLSTLIFNTASYRYVFNIMGFTLILYSVNGYFNSFLNGISNFKYFNILNIINSIITLILSIVLIKTYGLSGALIAIVVSQSVTSVATLCFMWKFKYLFAGFWNIKITRQIFISLWPFIKMTLFSAILLPISQLIIRKYIDHYQDSTAMGIYEAIMRISGVYMMLILNFMLIYYLPKISQKISKKEAVHEFVHSSILFLSILITMGALIYFLKYFILRTFLSESFISVSDLIVPQLISDLFKILYYVFAYFIISKSLSRYYIITEVFFFIFYVLLARYAIPIYGVSGAIYANGFMNAIIFLIHLYFIGSLYFKNRNGLTNFLFRK